MQGPHLDSGSGWEVLCEGQYRADCIASSMAGPPAAGALPFTFISTGVCCTCAA